MISEKETVRLENWINSALKNGAELLCGGKRKGAMRLQERYVEDTKPSLTLPPEARERIKRFFIDSLNKFQ